MNKEDLRKNLKFHLLKPTTAFLKNNLDRERKKKLETV